MHGGKKRGFEERFKSKPENAAKAAEAASPKRKQWQRINTSVPREWEVRLWEATRTSTYRLALELLYRGWRAGKDTFSCKDDPIIASSELAASIKLSPRSIRNALRELERLGLIVVVRTTRRAPRVTLLHVPKQNCAA